MSKIIQILDCTRWQVKRARECPDVKDNVNIFGS